MTQACQSEFYSSLAFLLWFLQACLLVPWVPSLGLAPSGIRTWVWPTWPSLQTRLPLLPFGFWNCLCVCTRVVPPLQAPVDSHHWLSSAPALGIGNSLLDEQRYEWNLASHLQSVCSHVITQVLAEVNQQTRERSCSHYELLAVLPLSQSCRLPGLLGEMPVTRYPSHLSISVYNLISCCDWTLHYGHPNEICPIECIHINSLSPEPQEFRLSGILIQIAPKALKH